MAAAAGGPPDERPGRTRRTGFIIIPCSAVLQAAEDDLGLALVAAMGGTRPAVSPAMVSHYLLERFKLTAANAAVSRHDPEDFVVCFQRREDRALLPLVWRPWRRTSMASAGLFRFMVLVGMTRVPLHARSVSTAQAILGPCCADVQIVHPRDVPPDDDREFFVSAWCLHSRFIPYEEIIFVREPRVLHPIEGVLDELPGLRYLVRIRLIASQDRNRPPPSPDWGSPGAARVAHRGLRSLPATWEWPRWHWARGQHTCHSLGGWG